MTEKSNRSWLFEFISSEAARYKRAILAYEYEIKTNKNSTDANIYSSRIEEAKECLEEMYDVLNYLEERQDRNQNN